ncbi:MAG: hypothetical protein Q9217_001697 [Psora testacea]
MKTGYPRFFIHRLIVKLGERLCDTFGHGDQMAMPFCCQTYANYCERYLKFKVADVQTNRIYVTWLAIGPTSNARDHVHWDQAELHVVFYPRDVFPHAKDFWQHTGFGISSRYAVYCLEHLDDFQLREALQVADHDLFSKMLVRKSEDRQTKQVLHQRIADLASAPDSQIGPEHVHLFPTGMSAISKIAEMIKSMNLSEDRMIIVAYGFLYLDTFKVLSKIYDFEPVLLGHSSIDELAELDHRLQGGLNVSALFCEFPGNPLLGSPNLAKVREMADKYGFVVVCDDTVGTFVNVNVLPVVDILVTSLTKIFSGACNVMGGSMVLNPLSEHYPSLQSALERSWVDTYCPDDAAVMEENGRDIVQRMGIINHNAEMVYKILKEHPFVTTVYYPKDSDTQEVYDVYRKPRGGYGYLLSAIFKEPEQAVAFYDALDVAKGPSLGTNFTLACAYTLFAHYGEREWAAKYGVEEYLVRISVGMEDGKELKEMIEAALQAIDNDLKMTKLLSQTTAPSITGEGTDLLQLVPNEPFLREICQRCKNGADAIIAHEAGTNESFTHAQLLMEVILLRDAIVSRLPVSTVEALSEPSKEVYLAILVPPGYDCLASMLTTLAVGAVMVPLSTAVLPEEAKYFFKLCPPSLIISTADCSNLAHDIGSELGSRTLIINEIMFRYLSIKDGVGDGSPRVFFELENKSPLDLEKSAIVIFTSGTTGPPKGVVHSRRSIYGECQKIRVCWDVSMTDVWLHQMPMHWSAGFEFALTAVLAGARLEFCTTVFSSGWFWEGARKGNFSICCGTPALYRNLVNHIDDAIREDPVEISKAAGEGARNIRILASAGDRSHLEILERWQKLRCGKPLVSIFGTTESFGVSSSDWKSFDALAPGSIGALLPGVECNLTDGEEGELRIKSNTLFKRYIFPDPDIMNSVFDSQGFYKTGDIAKRNGSQYTIIGRASQDIIRSYSYKVNANEVEDHILQLHEVAEVMVLGIPDEEMGERVAAVIRLSPNMPNRAVAANDRNGILTLAALRARLAQVASLAAYKQPTSLRVLEDDEMIPMGRTGKPSKVEARKRFFSGTNAHRDRIQMWSGDSAEGALAQKKAFDWAGIEAGST